MSSQREFKQPSLVQKSRERDGRNCTKKQRKNPVADLCQGLGVTHSSIVSDHRGLDTIPITTNRRMRGVHIIESNEQQ